MKTSEQIENSFRRDLDILLNKYKAEIEVVEVGATSYTETNRIAVYIPTKYNVDGDVTEEYADFIL